MTETAQEPIKKQSPLGMTLRRLAANRLALTGGIVFALLCLTAILAPYIAPYDWSAIDPVNKFLRPSAEHLFGTDMYGRDIFSRLLYGGRYSLSLGILATLVSTAGGVIIGSIAGYFGGRVDNLIMRFIDISSSASPASC